MKKKGMVSLGERLTLLVLLLATALIILSVVFLFSVYPNSILPIILLFVAVTIIFSILFVFVLRKTVTHPLHKIIDAIDEFSAATPEESTEEENSSFHSLPYQSNDEIGHLVDSLKAMEKRLNTHIENLDMTTRKAESDILTRLYNREAFYQRVSTFLRATPNDESHLHAFMIVDVDYFKETNETYGHMAGDELLFECAKALKNVFRSSDDVARIDGDQFAVFCSSIGTVQVMEAKAKQIRKAWQSLYIGNDKKMRATASIGIAFAPINGRTYEELQSKAFEALHEAKKRGRDNYVIASS